MVDIIEDVFHDTWLMLPLLFLAYWMLEYFERKDAFHAQEKLLSLKKFGPLLGAFIGLIPQCGFSVLAAGFYVDGVISLGTLIAVFISTSDEAITILFAHPEQVHILPFVLGIKWMIALIVGYGIDLLWHGRTRQDKLHPYELQSCFCEHHEHSIWMDALIRTLKIFGFVLVINFVLSFMLEFIGEEHMRTLLLNQNMFQPLLAALIGFIPNCAASVILAQLYVSGIVSFGALIAGLITSAGLGFMLLIKMNHRKIEVLQIFFVILIVAWFCGTILQLLNS